MSNTNVTQDLLALVQQQIAADKAGSAPKADAGIEVPSAQLANLAAQRSTSEELSV